MAKLKIDMKKWTHWSSYSFWDYYSCKNRLIYVLALFPNKLLDNLSHFECIFAIIISINVILRSLIIYLTQKIALKKLNWFQSIVMILNSRINTMYLTWFFSTRSHKTFRSFPMNIATKFFKRTFILRIFVSKCKMGGIKTHSIPNDFIKN